MPYEDAVLVAEWPRHPNKADSEIIRLQCQMYKGVHPVFALRLWLKDAQGNYQPTHSGVNLSAAHIPKIIEGLQMTTKTLSKMSRPINQSTKSKKQCQLPLVDGLPPM
jgi:hypothetical protein